MIQFAFPVAVRIIDAIINNPELIQFRIHVHAGQDPDPTDNAMFVAAILLARRSNLTRILFIQHRVIKYYVAVRRSDNLRLHILSCLSRGDFVPLQILLGSIVTELLRVAHKIRQRVIDLAHQQKLTVIQSRNFAHTLHYSIIGKVA